MLYSIYVVLYKRKLLLVVIWMYTSTNNYRDYIRAADKSCIGIVSSAIVLHKFSKVKQCMLKTMPASSHVSSAG